MSGNIFTGKDEKSKEEFHEKVEVHSKAILTVVERQKDLESSIDLIDEKLELLDHNSIKNFKSLFADIKAIREDMRDLQQDIIKIKEFDSKVSKQIKIMTTRDEVQKLEKYIDLWNPMDFVTRGELEEIHDKTIKELRKIIEKFLKE
ncbi:MAG: hypothetical protein KC589_00305 [Nanoarchaeota archaeon]|nr:hypothetical protein [Nanoarchaeota archaeon]